ncbi:VanZ family protein [Bacillus solitudinis]|uniref:VanZ family protein n=1 Tax=Bacillus solitudinis TaxID=2014074 RepID=UPI000C244F23|nr:VanZ family protein [Bacillus solitudinis]
MGTKHLRKYLYILLVLYIFMLFYVTLFAWNYGASLGPAGPGGRNYNLIPLRSIYRIAMFSPNIMDPIRILIGNVVLFIPLGFLLPLSIPKLRNIGMITTIGFLTSAFIEMCQFLFTHRVSNIDDVILNTMGTFIGVLSCTLLLWIKSRIVIFTT